MNIELPENVDYIETMEKTKTTKKHGPFQKTLVTIVFTLLAVSPVIVGFTYSNLGFNNPAYLVMKNQDEGSHAVLIHMVKSRLLNNPKPNAKKEAEGFLRKCTNNLPNCETNPLGRNEILLIDMDQDCFKDLKVLDDKSCLPFKGIVLIENWDQRSSRPINFKTAGHPVTEFPIITVSSSDAKNKTMEALQDNSFVNIIFDDFDSLLKKETDDIYQVKCPENGCTSMGYPALQEKSQIYIGCDGEAKLRAKVKMTCTSNGKRCPELETWKKQIEKSTEQFESCFGKNDDKKIVFPPAHCIKAEDGKVSPPKACDQERDFWSNSNDESTVCWNEKTHTVKLWKKECKKEKKCDKWGSWSNWIKPRRCSHRNKKERFRFCRINTDCVLIEWDRKWGNGTGDNCSLTANDDKEEYENPPNCEEN